MSLFERIATQSARSVLTGCMATAWRVNLSRRQTVAIWLNSRRLGSSRYAAYKTVSIVTQICERSHACVQIPLINFYFRLASSRWSRLFNYIYIITSPVNAQFVMTLGSNPLWVVTRIIRYSDFPRYRIDSNEPTSTLVRYVCIVRSVVLSSGR